MKGAHGAPEVARASDEAIIALRPRRTSDEELGDDLADEWLCSARNAQLPPADLDWCWLFLGGRGTGKKTHAMTGAIHTAVRAGTKRIHLIPCRRHQRVQSGGAIRAHAPQGIGARAPP